MALWPRSVRHSRREWRSFAKARLGYATAAYVRSPYNAEATVSRSAEGEPGPELLSPNLEHPARGGLHILCAVGAGMRDGIREAAEDGKVAIVQACAARIGERLAPRRLGELLKGGMTQLSKLPLRSRPGPLQWRRQTAELSPMPPRPPRSLSTVCLSLEGPAPGGPPPAHWPTTQSPSVIISAVAPKARSGKAAPGGRPAHLVADIHAGRRCAHSRVPLTAMARSRSSSAVLRSTPQR